MSEDVVAVAVRVLDKEYRVACPEDERDELLASARYLNDKMKEIRDTGKVIGADRVAVMAALNIAHELLLSKSHKDDYAQSITNRIKLLSNKIDAALVNGKQIEL
ncbi:MAG: cell division protein ZapA [Gammaproteobacteria bacterium]|jgi:cell division protein ZapA|nr:cell division protein ZapA [Gammaproteobacteria bacterium]